MTEYKNVRSSFRPNPLEITEKTVIVSKNIVEYEQDYDGQIITGYEYDWEVYDKDEYLVNIAAQNASAIEQLQDELKAAKIILGVD